MNNDDYIKRKTDISNGIMLAVLGLHETLENMIKQSSDTRDLTIEYEHNGAFFCNKGELSYSKISMKQIRKFALITLNEYNN